MWAQMALKSIQYGRAVSEWKLQAIYHEMTPFDFGSKLRKREREKKSN